MTDPERRVVESSYRESPASRPSFAVEVLAPTLIFTGAAWALFAVGAADTQLADRAAAVTCIVSLVVLLWLWHTEGRPVHITEHQRYVDEEPRRLRPVVGSSDAQRLRLGRWTFTETEWKRLGRVLATGKVTRAALADLQLDDGETMFTSLSERYPSIVEELQRLGWLTSENETTNVALAWFQDHGIDIGTNPPRDAN